MDTALNDKEILYCNFNQDQSCFAIGTQSGFKIFQTNPFKESFFRDLGGGIVIVEMLFKCNILALVGGGQNPKFPTNKVIIWDDHQIKIIGELSFRTDIKAVKLKSDKVVVVLENKIYVYNFSDLKLLDHIDTSKNPKGLFSLSSDANTTVLASLGKEVGYVSIHSYDTKKTFSVQAHQSPLGCLELNCLGTRLATASEKGTLVRIIDAECGTLLHELRRGSDYSQIYSINFHPNSNWICCSGDSNTVHIFSLQNLKNGGLKNKEEDDGQSQIRAKNPKSKFSFMKFLSPYFDSEWSFAQYKVMDSRTKVAFAKEDYSIYIIGYDGNFYTVNYDPISGGECTNPIITKIFNESLR